MTRLWFKVSEVLPIAEHAMACPTWRLTAAQVRAGALARPALIWDVHDDETVLYSNGEPGWFDDTGRPHTAPAWTWRHEPTGRRGTDGEPALARFLPLTHRPRGSRQRPTTQVRWWPRRLVPGRPRAGTRYPLITVLRRAAATGRHWLVIDTDPIVVVSGNVFRLFDHREEIVADDAAWVPATVTAHAVARYAYPALVADGYTIAGGDVIARFDRPTVERMITVLEEMHANTDPASDPMPGEYPVLHLSGDVVTVSEQFDDGHHQHLIETDRCYPDADGFYAIGAYLWPWHRVNGTVR